MSGISAGLPGNQFVSYTTASGAVSVTVSGLDLNTDLAYDFVVEVASHPGSAQKLQVVPNGAGTNLDICVGQYINQSAGITGFAATSAALWDVSCGQTGKAMSLTLGIRLAGDGRPHGVFAGSLDDRAGSTLALSGSAFRNATTNLTSMKFQLDGSTCDWRVFCSKRTRG